MTKNMLEILKSINNTHGQLVNNLIKSNILTVKDIVSAAIESEDASIIFSIVNYVNGLNSEDKEKLADAIIATKEAHYIYCFACNIKCAPVEYLNNVVYLLDKKDSNHGKITCLIRLANIDNLEAIKKESRMYRSLLLDENQEKPKTKVRKIGSK